MALPQGARRRNRQKSRPPRSARALLTTAREWLDTIAEQEDDDEDDEDY